jgi:hypothetical protein
LPHLGHVTRLEGPRRGTRRLNAGELNDDGTIEIAFAYHLGDVAVLKPAGITFQRP